MNAKDRILVALDVDSPDKAISLAQKLKGRVGGYKVGLQLFTLGGPQVVRAVGTTFLDLKFHDIPNTVAGATAAAAQLGVKMLNVHCLGGVEMMRAAHQASMEHFHKHGTRPLVIGVTILTSHDEVSLEELGISKSMSISERVAHLAFLAAQAGLDGVVCSPLEIETVRNLNCDKGFLIVTPGIRAATDTKGDQKRTLPAGEAVKRGADYLVIGRPITGQEDPAAAADRIAEEIDKAA